VRTAGDGREALQQVLAWAPCLILLDILMPMMDGRAFLPALWQLEERAETPVVLASGADGPLLWDANIRIADVIRKPFSLEQLVATAERLATQRSPDQHRTRHQPPDRGMRPARSAGIAVVLCGDRRRCRRLTGR
jgi:CheY-like chemotaxis protein